MKLTAKRDALKRAIGLAATVLPKHKSQDWMRYVRVMESGDICGTDSKLAVRVPVPGATIEPSDAGMLIPVQRVLQLLGEVSPGEITLEATRGRDSHEVTVLWGLSSMTIQTADPFAYPLPERAKPFGWFFRANAGQLRTALERVAFCVDPESARYALAGVRLEIKPGKGCVAATDSRRLAVDSFDATGEQLPDSRTELNGVIPAEAVRAIIDAIDDAEGEVHLAGNENEFEATVGARRISGPWLLGRFPEWRKLFVEDPAHILTISAADGRRLMRQALTMTAAESMRARLDFTEGQLRVSVRTADVGEMKSEAEAVYSGRPCLVGFDPRYLLQFFDRCGDTQVVWKFRAPDEAAQIEACDSYRYVVMPMAEDR